MIDNILEKLSRVIHPIVPHPPWIPATVAQMLEEEGKEETKRLEQISASKASSSLRDAAQRVYDEEEGRKSSADSRATVFLTAMVTLIPLMTWAVGASTPACRGATECAVWNGIFSAAVFYLTMAALWSLRTLSVANYNCMGAEDIRKFSYRPDPELAIAVETLINARLNRRPINRKIDFIIAAQRNLFYGITILAVLLASDPWMRARPTASNAETPKPQAVQAAVPAGSSCCVWLPQTSRDPLLEVKPPYRAP